MHYFRDSHFDQRLAYGMSNLRHTRSKPGRSRRPRPKARSILGGLVELIMPFVCMAATFAAAYYALDVLGLSHLVQTPSFDGVLTGAAECLALLERLLDAALHAIEGWLEQLA